MARPAVRILVLQCLALPPVAAAPAAEKRVALMATAPSRERRQRRAGDAVGRCQRPAAGDAVWGSRGGEFVALTPDGHYAASPAAARLIYSVDGLEILPVGAEYQAKHLHRGGLATALGR
jgi:hypothetical protein